MQKELEQVRYNLQKELEQVRQTLQNQLEQVRSDLTREKEQVRLTLSTQMEQVRTGLDFHLSLPINFSFLFYLLPSTIDFNLQILSKSSLLAHFFQLLPPPKVIS